MDQRGCRKPRRISARLSTGKRRKVLRIGSSTTSECLKLQTVSSGIRSLWPRNFKIKIFNRVVSPISINSEGNRSGFQKSRNVSNCKTDKTLASFVLRKNAAKSCKNLLILSTILNISNDVAVHNRIARNSNKYQLRTSPSNGTASLTTPFLHCTASLGQTSHLFVRRGERRMHYDGTSFIVRNAGHSAGFDDNNQLKVY